MTPPVEALNYVSEILDIVPNELIYINNISTCSRRVTDRNVGIPYTAAVQQPGASAKSLNSQAVPKMAPNLQVPSTRHDGLWNGTR